MGPEWWATFALLIVVAVCVTVIVLLVRGRNA